MNKHPVFIAALALGVAAAASIPMTAHAASDNKSFSPMGCRPLTPTDAAGLAFDTRGIINTTTVDKRVICEIDKDYETWYTPTNYATIAIWYKPGAVDGSVSCTFYRGSAASAAMTTTTGSSGTVPANSGSSYFYLTLDSYPSDFTGIGQNIVCTLTSKMILAHFYLIENGSTNTP
jgi:hypothetical protein